MATERIRTGYKEVDILTSAARTASGVSDEFFVNNYNELDGMIRATADTALTSLNVDVQSYNQTVNQWVTIGSFTQITSTPSLAESIPIVTGLGFKCRISYTLVGTSVTFAVGVILRI